MVMNNQHAILAKTVRVWKGALTASKRSHETSQILRSDLVRVPRRVVEEEVEQRLTGRVL